MSLPWPERISMISINPDSASRDDIARMAAELSEYKFMVECFIVWSEKILETLKQQHDKIERGSE